MHADGLMAAGCVNLVSLEPLRERLGERCWRHARDTIWRQVDICLGRLGSRGGEGARINETDCVIAVPSERPQAVQEASMRILLSTYRAVHMACRPADMVIHRVTEMRGDEIACVRLDAAAIFQGEAPVFAAA